jgi:hypothetical protein
MHGKEGTVMKRQINLMPQSKWAFVSWLATAVVIFFWAVAAQAQGPAGPQGPPGSPGPDGEGGGLIVLDANERVVGHFLVNSGIPLFPGNAALVNAGGATFVVLVTASGFESDDLTLFYLQPNCIGTPYVGRRNIDRNALLQGAEVAQVGEQLVAWFPDSSLGPVVKPTEVTALWSKSFNQTTPDVTCHESGFNGVLTPVRPIPMDGFLAPFRLR